MTKGLIVTGTIVTGSDADTFPTHLDNLGKGGIHSVATSDEMNAIPTERRSEGMVVYVLSAPNPDSTQDNPLPNIPQTYQLVGGTDNTNWQVANFSNLPTLGVTDVPELDPADPENVGFVGQIWEGTKDGVVASDRLAGAIATIESIEEELDAASFVLATKPISEKLSFLGSQVLNLIEPGAILKTDPLATGKLMSYIIPIGQIIVGSENSEVPKLSDVLSSQFITITPNEDLPNAMVIGELPGGLLKKVDNAVETIPITGTDGFLKMVDGTSLETVANLAPIDAAYILQTPDDSLPNSTAISELAGGLLQKIDSGLDTIPITGTDGFLKIVDGASIETVENVAPTDASYILQTPSASLPTAQALDELGAGIAKIAVEGVIELAIPNEDYATPEGIQESVEQAQTAATNAETSATEAANSATAADSSATAAETAATAAETAATAAEGSATAAATSASAAGGAAATAIASAGTAVGSAADAAGSAGIAAGAAAAAALAGTGPQGRTGDTGAQGDKGDTGPAGKDGTDYSTTDLNFTGAISGTGLLINPIVTTFNLSLDQITVPATHMSLNNFQINYLANGIASTDAVNLGQLTAASAATLATAASTYTTLSAVKALTLNQFAIPITNLNLNTQLINNLGNGVANTDAVNLGQMNAAITSATSSISQAINLTGDITGTGTTGSAGINTTLSSMSLSKWTAPTQNLDLANYGLVNIGNQNLAATSQLCFYLPGDYNITEFAVLNTADGPSVSSKFSIYTNAFDSGGPIGYTLASTILNDGVTPSFSINSGKNSAFLSASTTNGITLGGGLYNTITLNSTIVVNAQLNMNSFKITSLASGVATTDAVNLGQMNTAISNAISSGTSQSINLTGDITGTGTTGSTGFTTTLSSNILKSVSQDFTFSANNTYLSLLSSFTSTGTGAVPVLNGISILNSGNQGYCFSNYTYSVSSPVINYLSLDYQASSSSGFSNALTVNGASSLINVSYNITFSGTLGVTGATTLAAVSATSLNMNSNTITNVANGTVSTDAVNYGQLTSVGSTVGDYKHSAQKADHNKWLLCDGRSLSQTTYAALYAVIANTYGGTSSGGTFNLPTGAGTVLAAPNSSNTIGTTAGADSITLTTAQMPSHTHTGTTNASAAYSAPSAGQYIVTCNRTPVSQYTTPNGSPYQAFYNNEQWNTFNPANTHTHSFTTAATGTGSAVNIRQNTLYAGNLFIYGAV